MNFKHLHYFWVAAKAGGIVRAGEQLHITPQTLSEQIKLLEDSLGQALFRKRGRGVELTEEGRLALGYADKIFALGNELENAVRESQGSQKMLEFRVGVADSMAKPVVYRLLEPALLVGVPVRLICSVGKFGELLAQLALHRLDLVIADEPITNRVSVKAFNHALGSTPMTFFCTPALKATLKGDFPQCLNDAPMLVQGACASIRTSLEGWLVRHHIHPRIVGEFDDLTLLKTFGGQGQGIFMAASMLDAETITQYGVEVLGRSDEMVDNFFAISVERRITHPCVSAIAQVARKQLGLR
ncbi:MAG: transcriptional activator NhaR [Pseudomonadota bacterium]